MTVSGNGVATPRIMNPLWVVSLFLTLSEVTVGLAATQASGWVQGLLAVFAVVFPCAVFAAFFTVLWKRPFVLYAPGDFTADTPIATFVGAMQSSSLREAEAVDAAVRRAVEVIVREERTRGEISTKESEELIETAVRVGTDDYRNRLLTVDLTTFDSALGPEPFTTPISDRTSVDQVLNLLYFALSPKVKPYTYGRDWVLYDPDTKKMLTDLGTIWARLHTGKDWDERPAVSVGLRPGMRLAVKRLP